VVYIEPYKKSKAADFHDEAIAFGFAENLQEDKVRFEPFVGVGPRHFFDLFSMNLGSGLPLSRKDANGMILVPETVNAKLRIQMMPASYLDLELIAVKLLRELVEKAKNGK
jgi:hypothetical protein